MKISIDDELSTESRPLEEVIESLGAVPLKSKHVTVPIGTKFGRWIVLRYSHYRIRYSKNKREFVHYWLCRCDCGTERPVIAQSLTKTVRQSLSCGCLTLEHTIQMGHDNATHGLTGSPEYRSWVNMRNRCEKPSLIGYERYGGRGIKVCERWRTSFENFFADMGPKPTPQHSIERVDTNGNYEPNNCRWATAKEQARNTRRTIFVEYRGETKPLAEWCEQFGVNVHRVDARLARGWSVEDAFFVPALRGTEKCIGGSVSRRRRHYA